MAAKDQPLRRRKRSPIIVIAMTCFAFVAVCVRIRGAPGFSDDGFLSNSNTTIISKDDPFSSSTSSSDPSLDSSTPHTEDPGTCFTKFPWIQPALDQFYAPALAAHAASLQTSEESLEAMANITWIDGYHPGFDIITLHYDEALQRYNVSIFERWRSNQPHKSQCIVKPLIAAIEAHGAALAAEFGRQDIKFALVTEDFAINWRGLTKSLKIPAFVLCTDDSHIDIPIPDFTYGCYPETQYQNSSWAAVSNLLSLKAGMMPWAGRVNSIFHRSNWEVGPRRALMPLLQKLADSGEDEEILGGKLDIGDSGFVVSKKENFVWLDEQCQHKVAIHTAGFSYSAGLKYKLACGSLVVHFDSPFTEFYEPALVDGVHVLRLPATEEGVDETEFFEKSAPKIKGEVEVAMQSVDVPAIAAAGQEFALTQLSEEGLNCYWYGALLRYGRLYLAEQTPAQAKKAEKEGSGGRKKRRGTSGGGGGASKMNEINIKTP